MIRIENCDFFHYISFEWDIDGDASAIGGWNPCLGQTSYSTNISQEITLTAPSTGTRAVTEYALHCVSVQYFDQSEDGTLGSANMDLYDGYNNFTNQATIKIHVKEENNNGANITVTKITSIFPIQLTKYSD